MSRIKFLDGALGTNLWEMSGTNGNVWELNMTAEDTVFNLHKMYVEAGSEIIATNTFSVNKFSVAKKDYSVCEVIKRAVEIAKRAVKGTDVKVALDIGPLPELLEPYGDLTEEECESIYDEIISCGVQEKPSLIFFETFMDLEMLKIAVKVACKYGLPIFASMTFEPMGKTIMGNSVSDMIEGLKEYDISAIGLNCSNEPNKLINVIREFRDKTDKPLIFKPNAGLPQQVGASTLYKTDEDIFVTEMMPTKDLGEIYIGGCCGTKPSYIKKLVKKMK